VLAHIFLRRCVFVFAIIALFSCGGSPSDEPLYSSQDSILSNSNYNQAYASASAKQDEAVALGVQSPCEKVEQCGFLSLRSMNDACPNRFFYRAYSRISPTAADAEAVAAEAKVLEDVALELAPRSSSSNPCLTWPAPKLVCEAGVCNGQY
jgi:hypothetical protein